MDDQNRRFTGEKEVEDLLKSLEICIREGAGFRAVGDRDGDGRAFVLHGKILTALSAYAVSTDRIRAVEEMARAMDPIYPSDQDAVLDAVAFLQKRYKKGEKNE